MDSYIYLIVILLPLAALMLVLQVNPYHALVIRGILGALAALVYAVLGAADVALTEALVGTMLAITLYAVAVRSSLVMRLGILEEVKQETEIQRKEMLEDISRIIEKHHLRLELIKYPHPEALHGALMAEEVHAICTQPTALTPDAVPNYHTMIRVRRLFEILQTELTSPLTTLSYVRANMEEKH